MDIVFISFPSAHRKEWKINETRDETRHASNLISQFLPCSSLSRRACTTTAPSLLFSVSLFFIIVSIAAQ